MAGRFVGLEVQEVESVEKRKMRIYFCRKTFQSSRKRARSTVDEDNIEVKKQRHDGIAEDIGGDLGKNRTKVAMIVKTMTRMTFYMALKMRTLQIRVAPQTIQIQFHYLEMLIVRLLR